MLLVPGHKSYPCGKIRSNTMCKFNALSLVYNIGDTPKKGNASWRK